MSCQLICLLKNIKDWYVCGKEEGLSLTVSWVLMIQSLSTRGHYAAYLLAALECHKHNNELIQAESGRALMTEINTQTLEKSAYVSGIWKQKVLTSMYDF